MKHVYKLTYIPWVKDILHSSGDGNRARKQVVSTTQWGAAQKLRELVFQSATTGTVNIEILSIEDLGPVEL